MNFLMIYKGACVTTNTLKRVYEYIILFGYHLDKSLKYATEYGRGRALTLRGRICYCQQNNGLFFNGIS